MKPFVAIARNSDISKAVQEALDQIKLPDLTGKKILLKPNVGREVDPSIALNTNPVVVQAVYEYLKNHFQAQYFIGDSPIVNADTKKAFIQSGFESFLEDPKCKFLDLDALNPITLNIPNGKIINKIRVTGYWESFNYIISIPVLKMHMHTGASLSFKNCKGLLYKRDKVDLHHLESPTLIEKLRKKIPNIKELDVAIADLAYVIQPNLAIIDASFALEGLGPSGGTAKQLNTIIVSTDFLAADIMALAIAQPSWNLDNVPHLKLIAEQRSPKGPFSLKDIQTIPNDITPLINKLEEPPKSITFKYPNINVIDLDSCSACLSTIFMFIKHQKEFIDQHFTPEKPLNFAIGKGIKDTQLYEPTFLIGNCTVIRRTDGIFIKGCTPVESLIRKIIEDYLTENKTPQLIGKS